MDQSPCYVTQYKNIYITVFITTEYLAIAYIDRCCNGNVFIVKPDCTRAVALVHGTVMNPVSGVNECTWTEVNLRAYPGPHDEACRGCAIRFHR